jgi:hypothetical protein
MCSCSGPNRNDVADARWHCYELLLATLWCRPPHAVVHFCPCNVPSMPSTPAVQRHASTCLNRGQWADPTMAATRWGCTQAGATNGSRCTQGAASCTAQCLKWSRRRTCRCHSVQRFTTPWLPVHWNVQQCKPAVTSSLQRQQGPQFTAALCPPDRSTCVSNTARRVMVRCNAAHHGPFMMACGRQHLPVHSYWSSGMPGQMCVAPPDTPCCPLPLFIGNAVSNPAVTLRPDQQPSAVRTTHSSPPAPSIPSAPLCGHMTTWPAHGIWR